MTSTQATILIPADSIAAARQDFPDNFSAEYNSNIGTVYVGTGLFFDNELNKIVNEVEWQRIVRFGSFEAVMQEFEFVRVEQPGEI